MQPFFSPPTHPIGIDLEDRTLRLVQVQTAGDAFRIRAAACNRLAGQTLGEADVRQALRAGAFAGREAVVALPAAAVDGLDQPIRPQQRAQVDAMLQTLAAAGVGVIAVRPLPTLLAALARNVFRRVGETTCTALHVHLSADATLLAVAVANELRQVTTVDFSTQTIVRALAGKLCETDERAAALRDELLHAAAAVDWQTDRTLIHRPAAGQIGHPLHAAASEAQSLCAVADALQTVAATEVGPVIDRLQELRRQCSRPIDRLLFSGSGTMDRRLCERIAETLRLPAHVLDPILRVRGGQTRELVGGIDRRLPQPAWAAAIAASIAAGKAVTA